MGRKKELTEEQKKIRNRRNKRKYKLKKKIGHPDAFADPMFGANVLGEQVDEEAELNRALRDEEKNPLVFNQFLKEKKKKEKKNNSH